MAKCPICKAEAQEIEPGFFDGTTFRCPKHGEFDVADSVLSTPDLMNADSARWEKVLENGGRTSCAG